MAEEQHTGGSWGLASRSKKLLVCDAAPHAPVSASRLLLPPAFSSFVGFLEPARPARLVRNRGSDIRVISQISGRLLLTEPDPPSQGTLRKPA